MQTCQCVRGALILLAISLASLVLLTPTSGFAQTTATDLPMWFDVSSEQPPNIKINTDLTTQLQNEEQVAVDPTNPDNLVAVWRDFRIGFRQVGWGYSHDGGSTWTEGGLIPATPYNRDSDPGIVAGSNGVFYSIILSFDEFSAANGLWVPFSVDSGLSFLASIPAIDHPSEEQDPPFEDKELMAIDNTGGPTDGNLYVAWTRFGTVADIYCVSSTDGVGFGPAVRVSDISNGLQWPTPVVGTNGTVLVAWASSAGIRYDLSFDEGVTFGADRLMQPTGVFSTIIPGNILVFAYPALASDITGGPFDGNYYCAYSDIAVDGALDLLFTKSVDGGDTWSTPLRINDDPVSNGADQFHPWTTVNPDGVVSVAFYDRRLDPNNLNFDLWITHSFDGGDTWTPDQRVSDISSSPFDAAPGLAKDGQPGIVEPYDPDRPGELQSPQAGLIGEYIGLTSSRLRATLVFTDTRNGNQDVYAANMPLRLFPPRQQSPVDGADLIPQSTLFEWDDYSIYDADLTYILEYSTDPTFAGGVVRHDGIVGHSFAGDMLDQGLHYWRMRAVDPAGDSSAYSAVWTFEVGPFCGCDCFADPACDAITNVFDVVAGVDVAFRNAPPILDPDPSCPREDTDINCNNVTNVFDVVGLVDVAFRNADPQTTFCDPCAQ